MIELRTFALFAAVAVPAALLASACSSDASLGGDRDNPLGSSGKSNAGSSGSGNSSAGSGNSSAGSGNSSAGSGNSSGSSGGPTGSSGSGNGSGEGGSGGAESCEDVQCLRAIECVETCGGPVLKASCCPCDPGTFDNIECGSGGGGAPNLDDLNSDCSPNGACPEDLTPVRFYGVAGEAGPEFCWCTIPCDDDPNVCPETTTCTTIADGPGTVCSAN